MRVAVSLHRTQRTSSDGDGLIIYTDTDDVVSQLPGSLSDMVHEAKNGTKQEAITLQTPATGNLWLS